jgi:DNA-binding YbaB/EbfC family protein
MGDIQKLAQKMQADMAKAQDDLAAMSVEGSAGGGAVRVAMSGTQELKEVHINKDAVDPDDVETLEDLVRAAVTDALAKSKQLAADKLGGLTGGLKIPGL